MEQKELLHRVDHTLLAQTATWSEIQQICDDGIRYGCASVCIPPSYVKQAAEYLQGRLPVCTVIGFPNGYNTTAVKCFEAETAVNEGAAEIDMVINLGWVKDQKWGALLAEIKAVKAACHGKLLKVIIETCLLTEDEKIKLCDIVSQSGADFIKTSTGKGYPGATPEAVYTMCQVLKKYHSITGKRVGIKVAGGVRTAEEAVRYYTIVKEVLGNDWLNKDLFRIGASSLVEDIEHRLGK